MVCDYCGTTGHGTSSTRPLFDDEFVYCLLYCHLFCARFEDDGDDGEDARVM